MLRLGRIFTPGASIEELPVAHAASLFDATTARDSELYSMPSNPPIPEGARSCLLASQSIGAQAIEQDNEEEVESLLSGIDLDDRTQQSEAAGTYYLRAPNLTKKKQKLDPELMKKNLKKASQNVVVDNTLNEYRRYWQQFKSFCVDLKFVEEIEQMELYREDVPEELPLWVATWIMSKADDIDIYTGEEKDPRITRVKYGTAQKMRAAISHKFGRDFGFGERPFMQNTLTGKWTGNPSLSVAVAQYMISLQRRKVRKGEDVTSARAITHDIMRQLWEYNIAVPLDLETRKRKIEKPEEWAGHRIRQMLHLLYTLSMLCLLRFDEALRIMWNDMKLLHIDGVHCIRLDLPFRKTAQYGGIAPFFLYPDNERPWMCPVRALANWWTLCTHSNVKCGGYIFRKRIGKDDISARALDCMSHDHFIECFRNNLLDISIDPRPYGTHSFRRGGCQYLAMVKRWPIRDICTWGGWAENFDNPGTIFKYLMSWVDAPSVDRKDYFNPKRAASDPCHQCGRTCFCA